MNYQFIRRLEKEGFISLKELYIDGTKIKANTNRYTFVWWGLNEHLAGLLNMIDILYKKYNTFLHKNGYGFRYNLGPYVRAQGDGQSPEGHRKKNRKRKIARHKKIPSKTIIEIDNCSPLEILGLQKNLLRISKGEGKHKSTIQNLY